MLFPAPADELREYNLQTEHTNVNKHQTRTTGGGLDSDKHLSEQRTCTTKQHLGLAKVTRRFSKKIWTSVFLL